MNVKSDTANAPIVFESWIKLYTNSLYSWALFKTSNKESAEDLVQDTFLRAYQQLEKFRGDSNPKTWLMAILNNKIAAYYRKQYRSRAILNEQDSGLPGNGIFMIIFDDNDNWKKTEKPLDWEEDETQLLDNKEFNVILTSCLGKLPEHWRSAVNLKFIEQKKGELICQELNIAPTNFWQILHRAKLQLRKCLEVNWFKT